ncbi:MAG TPA: hypothetical protein VIS06_13890 [Mycobacteriales bacterium]
MIETGPNSTSITIIDPREPERDPLKVCRGGGDDLDGRLVTFQIGDEFVHVNRADAEAIAEFITKSYRRSEFAPVFYED